MPWVRRIFVSCTGTFRNTPMNTGKNHIPQQCNSPALLHFTGRSPIWFVGIGSCLRISNGPKPKVRQSDSLILFGSSFQDETSGPDRKKPPLNKCRIRLPCAKAKAMSREGANRLLWMLFVRITALKDSKPSVANRMAGPNRRMCSGRCSMM